MSLPPQGRSEGARPADIVLRARIDAPADAFGPFSGRTASKRVALLNQSQKTTMSDNLEREKMHPYLSRDLLAEDIAASRLKAAQLPELAKEIIG